MDRHAAQVHHGAGIGVLGDARDSHRHDLTTKLPQSDCLVLIVLILKTSGMG